MKLSIVSVAVDTNGSDLLYNYCNRSSSPVNNVGEIERIHTSVTIRTDKSGGTARWR